MNKVMVDLRNGRQAVLALFYMPIAINGYKKQKCSRDWLHETDYMMRNLYKVTLSLALLIIMFPATVSAQPKAQPSNPLAYLERTFPKLTNLYRDELSKYPAHYIFAVDVSGTMNQYEEMVVNSIIPFFNALPTGDRVDIIPFGSEALPNLVSYSGVIDNHIKTALCQNISRLYNDPSYPDGFKAYTDIEKAITAVSKVMQTNRDYRVNVIVVLTDFRNDVQGDNPSEHKFSEEQLHKMNELVSAATNNTYTRSIALELPVDQTKPGYCLRELKSDVFPTDGSGLEIIPMSNPGQMIGQWFEQLKREIMVTKLRAVIDLENRTAPIALKTKIDIDGNVDAEIHWKPSKLYPTMRIDSTYLSKNDFYFINNKENFQNTKDTDLKLHLGKIKNRALGFHHLSDSLNLGILLPTPYDDELASLGVKKPLPNTQEAVEKWLFTFPLPFWVSCVILALIIAYIIWVLMAARRNSNYRINADVSFYDSEDEKIGPTKKPNGMYHLKVGKGGSNACGIFDAEWQFEVNRVKSNIFLPWSKPHFEWHKTQGIVYAGKKRANASGILDKNSNNTLRLTCCDKDGERTHTVKLRMKED